MNNATRLAAALSLIVLALVPATSQATVTISPLPGTPTAMPSTQISFLGAPAGELHGIAVVGSATGRHSGRLRSYASAPGASFIPTRPFAPGERVTVRATLTPAHGRPRTLSDIFTVAQPMGVTNAEFPKVPGTPADEQSFLSAPFLHPPVVTIDQDASSAPPGYVFAAPFMGPAQYGPMIFDNTGRLIWFRPVSPGQDAADFKVQRYRGHPVLTWWQGRTIVLGMGLGEDVIADTHYRTIAVVKAGNGLQADEHEFTVTPAGQAFITAYSPVKANLLAAGGQSDGVAVEGTVQEIDVHTGLVMWEWHSLGNVDVSESYSKPPPTPTGAYDYFHVNSVDLLPEGNVLLSARNTWALYEINVRTGAVVWRLGGKRSTFALGVGAQFAYQHDARMLPGGLISVFDDEGAPTINPPTRGEILKLDLKARTATLVQSFVRNSGPLITGSQGDVQLLPGGNRMVGWGGLPNFTEFNPHGQIVFDGQFPKGEMSYRVYREPWNGQPAAPPAVAAVVQREPAPCHVPACTRALRIETTIYVSWNGATDVSSWRVLAGSNPTQLKPVTRVTRSGFETNVSIPGTASYVQVQALSANGKTLARSAVVKPRPE